MRRIADLRLRALGLFRAGLAAADPARALRASFDRAPWLDAERGPRYLVAVGKASVAMMTEAMDYCEGVPIAGSLAVTNRENLPSSCSFPVICAGHPLPDAGSLRAGEAVSSLLAGAGAGSCVLFLLSGGGSALLVHPVCGVGLSDKIRVTDLLLKSGAGIAEINEVRRVLSRLKGGGAAQLAAPASIHAFILSDTPPGDLAAIASGPTIPGSTNGERARAVLVRYGLLDKVPEAVRLAVERAVSRGVVSAKEGRGQNIVIGDNAMSVRAVDREASRSMESRVMCGWLAGDVGQAAVFLADEVGCAVSDGREGAFLCGGEVSVRVVGDGEGGRNQELAVRFALAMEERGHGDGWVFLSAGTDGRDGPTDAAGALVDPGSLRRARWAGLDIMGLLTNNDSHAILQASGDLVRTGGVGTNVGDLQIALIGGL